ncbi:MAG: M20/M25/M40 family metallo-hydrolase [Butyricicoccus sp.]|nr:M20/M25/M40 family metallo-hydrolase [Butyricicoccus sp.]
MSFTNQEIIDGVLAAFYPLCAIPHGSGRERAIADYLERKLRTLGACVQRDAIHNIWADVPGTEGLDNAPIIALQAHMDMVCAVGTADYDAASSPIETCIQDGWLSTGGRSSLGADCGAGVALILWLLEQDIPHPPLRILFTAQEEIGLNGAREIDARSVEGVRELINLDGFSSQRILVGAAGGTREHYARALETVPSPAGKSYRITISGLTGGHSGFDIEKRRGNAILWMGELLRRLQTKTPFAIASLHGGQAFNAIPYQCLAEIVTAVSIEQAATDFAQEIQSRHVATDPQAKITIEPCEKPARVWAGSVTSGMLPLLGGFADGVYAMHPELPGVVSDSSNLGRVYEQDGAICLDAMIRFMDVQAEMALRQSHQLVAGMCGFAGSVRTRYPAWPAEPDSALAKRMRQLHQKYIPGEPQIVAQHVGLEPSYFYAKNPNLSCIGLGMDIEGCHSPDERWRLDSIPPLARMLMEYLAQPVAN